LSPSTSASLLEVRVGEDPRVHFVEGELCLSTVHLLREPLFEAIETGSGNLLVDLTECTFIDSSGLEVLALASWRLAAAHPNRRLVVVSPRSAVRRILDLTGMDHIVTVRDSREQAGPAMNGGPPETPLAQTWPERVNG
jgi:anti-sigma B factor antagonist